MSVPVSETTQPLVTRERASRVAGSPVRRLFDALKDLAGDGAQTELLDASPWASGMFEGMRYSLMLAVGGSQAVTIARLLRLALPEAEFHISGHVVADLTVADLHEGNLAAVLTLSVLMLRES